MRLAAPVQNATDLLPGNVATPDIAAQIYVEGPATVYISYLVVDGGTSWDAAAATLNLVGIYYQNASGTVNHVVTRNQAGSPHGGSSLGFGIFAEATSTPSAVTVEYSSVHDFDKNGIVARGSDVTLKANLNQVRGNLPTAGDAENGIEIAYGATGTVTNNTVSDLIWAPCVSQTDGSCDPGSASGILVYDSPNVTINTNHVNNTQGGIAVVGIGRCRQHLNNQEQRCGRNAGL